MSKIVSLIDKEIKKHNDRKALGYDETMNFNHGFLCALLYSEKITKKEYNMLKKVHCYGNDDCLYFIGKGGFLEKDK